MAGDDVTITIRANNGDAMRAFRDVNGQLRDMRGRFVSEGSTMSSAMNRVTAAVGGVKGALIPLATAAVPLGAALAPIAVKASAAGVAVAAFGAAVAGQVSHLSEATQAQDKYTDAVTQYGRGSKQAADAQRTLSTTLAAMPQSTARAAVALGTLKDGVKSWSDEMADFTMTPVEKSFTLLGQAIPKLTPMVKGASAELDRLVTVAGGAMASPGFDALTEKVAEFANSALKDAVDGTIHFMRALSEGDTSGPIKAFMEYAAQNGPAMRETLSSVGDAVSTLARAAADAGPGMLTLVNAAAGLVASFPPGLITVLMQTAVALKAVSLAGAAATAISGGIASLGTRIATLTAASAAAGGGLAGLNAALNTLSTGGKAMLAAGAIGALAVAMHQLSDNKAPVAVDELSTSLNTLISTGKVTGALKTNFDEVTASIAMMSKGASDNKFMQLTSDFGTWLGMSTGPGISDAKKNLDAWDKSMAQLVKSGHPEQAAAQYDLLRKAWQAGGGDLKRLGKFTNDYDNALADSKFEQEHAAEAMGVFGAAAQETSAKLEAQKASADGLRASILALNEVNRSAYDAQIGFEESLDNLTASFKEHGATLDLDTEAGRANARAMSATAKSQDDLIASGLAAGESLGSMTKKSNELRETMMRLALDAFDGNKQKATEYVNTLLGVPSDIRTLVELERQEAITGLGEVRDAIQATPGAKEVTVSTLNGAAIAALEAVGLKTKTLPDGRTMVYTANGQALGSIGAVSTALNNLNGKTARTFTTHTIRTINEIITRSKTYRSVHDIVGATGGLFTGKGFRYADGGLVSGPGTGTSDDVFAPWLSNGEFVIKAAAVQKYGEKFLQRLNDGEIEMPRFAKGGKVSKQAKAEAEARRDAWSDLTVSHFGRMAGFRRSEFGAALGRPDSLGALVSALSQWRSTILKATHGGQERSLLRALDSTAKKLIGWEKQLTSVTKSLDKAKDKLNSLRDAASSLASSVKSGVLGSANITRGVSGDRPTTVRGIMGGLMQSRDKATAFAGALRDLKKKGLSSSLLRQIAEAGIEGGGLETAGALLTASGSEISSLNDLQGQIGKAAGSAGKTTADAVYGKAIKEQAKTVAKLERSQDKLRHSMEKLTRVMERRLEKAFKGKAGGGIVGAAAAGGIRSNLTWVGEQGPELLDLPAGSRVWSNPDSRRMAAAPWASMLNTPRRGPASGAATAVGGRAQEVKVVFEVRAGDSGRYTAFLVQEMQRAVRAYGSIEATFKPPRGR